MFPAFTGPDRWLLCPAPSPPSLRSITPHRPADLREASHDRWLWTVLLFFNPHNATSLFFIMSTPCLPLNPLVLVLNDCVSQKVISMYLFLLHFIFRAWHLEMFHIKIYWCSLTAQRVLSLLWLWLVLWLWLLLWRGFSPLAWDFSYATGEAKRKKKQIYIDRDIQTEWILNYHVWHIACTCST